MAGRDLSDHVVVQLVPDGVRRDDHHHPVLPVRDGRVRLGADRVLELPVAERAAEVELPVRLALEHETAARLDEVALLPVRRLVVLGELADLALLVDEQDARVADIRGVDVVLDDERDRAGRALVRPHVDEVLVDLGDRLFEGVLNIHITGVIAVENAVDVEGRVFGGVDTAVAVEDAVVAAAGAGEVADARDGILHGWALTLLFGVAVGVEVAAKAKDRGLVARRHVN